MGDLKRIMIGVIFLLAFGYLEGCSYNVTTVKPEGPGDYFSLMDHKTGGFQRRYRLHIPPGYHPDRPLPLVVALHGAFSSGKQMARRTGLNAIADRENFLVLYPDGIGLFGLLQHWNAGHCCGKAWRDGLDDVGFIKAAMDDVASKVNVDRDRVYMLGYSNGGMMAYRFAAERPGDLAALAVVAGSVGSRPDDDSPWKMIPSPKTRVPLILVHGRKDDHIPYEGGHPARGNRSASFVSVRDSAAFWTGNRGGPGWTENPGSNPAIRRQSWPGGYGGPAVELYSLEGWGHDWPGPVNYRKGSPFPEFDAAEVIWRFFRKIP